MNNFFNKPQKRQNAQHEREERKARDFKLLVEAFANTYEPVSGWCEGIAFFTMSDLRKMFSVWAMQGSDQIDDLLAELVEQGFSIGTDVHNRMVISTRRRNHDLIPPNFDPEEQRYLDDVRRDMAPTKDLPEGSTNW